MEDGKTVCSFIKSARQYKRTGSSPSNPADRRRRKRRRLLKKDTSIPFGNHGEWSTDQSFGGIVAASSEVVEEIQCFSNTSSEGEEPGPLLRKLKDVGSGSSLDGCTSVSEYLSYFRGRKEMENNPMTQQHQVKEEDSDVISDADCSSTSSSNGSQEQLLGSNSKEGQALLSQCSSATAIDEDSDRSWHSPIPVHQVSTGFKASKWIKELTSSSPSAQPDSNRSWSMTLCNSSSKKKRNRKPLRKLASVRGGLADQMQRVLEREKSSVAFWQHTSSRGVDQEQEEAPSVTVQIESAIYMHSLLLTEVTMLSETGPKFWQKNGDSIFVYFSAELAENLPIHIKSVVKISSPWQSVEVVDDSGTNRLVLFSTHFCELIKEGVANPSRATPRKQTQVPFSPLKSPSLTLNQSQLTCQQNLFSQSSVTTKAGSLVDALDGFSCPGNIALSVSVRAAYRYKHDTTQGSKWVLLMEDDHRLFMELIIREEHLEAWSELISNGLDRKFDVYQIQFCERVDRYQRQKLFTLIESLSIQRDYSGSDNSFYCGSNICCFIFKTLDGSQWRQMVPACNERAVNYKPGPWDTIGSLSKLRVSCTARIVYSSCNDLETYPSGTEPTEDNHDTSGSTSGCGHFVYAVVHCSVLSDRPRLVRIRLLTSFTPVDSSSWGLPGTLVTISNALLVRTPNPDKRTGEARTTGGPHVWCLDSYSLVVPATETPPTDITGPLFSIPETTLSLLLSVGVPCLPPLSEESMITNTLVSLSGEVVGVDETSALVWLTCSDCGSNIDQPLHQFHEFIECMCDECGQTTEPEVYFELSVILCISGRPEWKVIVKLTQETVCQYLPVSLDCLAKVHSSISGQDFTRKSRHCMPQLITMGLDIGGMLYKPLSLNVCLVTGVQHQVGSPSVRLKELDTTWAEMHS